MGCTNRTTEPVPQEPSKQGNTHEIPVVINGQTWIKSVTRANGWTLIFIYRKDDNDIVIK